MATTFPDPAGVVHFLRPNRAEVPTRPPVRGPADGTLDVEVDPQTRLTLWQGDRADHGEIISWLARIDSRWAKDPPGPGNDPPDPVDPAGPPAS